MLGGGRKQKQIYIEAIGCTRRSIDTTRIARYFAANGWTITPDPAEADLIYYTTCSYNKERTDACFSRIGEFQKYRSDLLLGGCLFHTDPEDLEKIYTRPFINNYELGLLDKIFPDHTTRLGDIGEPNDLWANFEDRDKSYQPRTEKFIKIQRGCKGSCGYCAIRKANPVFQSYPLYEIKGKVRAYLERSVRRFRLIGEDLGAYGVDIDLDFPHLLGEIIGIDKGIELGIDDVNPVWLVKYHERIVEVIGSGQIKSAISPIQSGNPEVLRRMNRFSSVEAMKSVYHDIKAAFPAFYLATNCMIGYPGETREQCEDTLSFLVDVDFDYGRIFPFTLKKNTPAEKLDGRLSISEMEGRLASVVDRLSKSRYGARRIGVNRIDFYKQR